MTANPSAAPSERHRTPDDVKAKIPLSYGWPPKLAVVETYGDERERKEYGVGPAFLSGPDGRLPPEAADAFLRFTGVPEEIKETDPEWLPSDPDEYPDFGEGGSDVWIAACEECGYLTDSDAATKTTCHRTYNCPNEYRVETTTRHNGDHTPYDSEEAWNVDVELDGEDEVSADADPDHTLVVTHAAEHGHDPEILGVSRVELDEGRTEVSGETAGKEWDAEVEWHDDGTMRVEWHRTGEGGTEYALAVGTEYRERECGNTSFTKVYPSDRARGEYVDVPNISAEQVPNHPSHLGRLKSKVGSGLSGDQMTERVEDAILTFHASR